MSRAIRSRRRAWVLSLPALPVPSETTRALCALSLPLCLAVLGGLAGVLLDSRYAPIVASVRAVISSFFGGVK